MEELVPLLNKLQDALVSAGVAAPGVLFDLPQIAVVGAQSVGKSSVLEALVGKQFLPNGTGIVTRRPLILQLQVRRIVYQYISKPSAIILAVTAANTDIANSDSLKIAREVDPHGQRTVGVVTKIDTLEPGTDCVDLLCNRVIPLKHGYVGVVCRGPRQQPQRQQDEGGEEEMLHQPSYRAAAQAEAQFFRSHAAYAAIASQHGVPYLAKTLNRCRAGVLLLNKSSFSVDKKMSRFIYRLQLLLNHVRQALPELRRKVAALMQQTEAELTNYGDPLVEAKANPGALLLHFFSKFARNFQDVIDGKLQAQHTSEQLMGGARINFIFHDWYSRALAEFDPLEGLSDQEIRTAIRNATGPKAALFVPEGAFEILVRKQIQQLETPSLQCVDQVYEELQKIVEKCELVEMSRFACLRERVMEVVRGVLRRCLAPTYQMIHNIIQIELAYINTNHPDFMNNRFAVDSRPPGSQQCGSCSSGSIGGSSGNNGNSSNTNGSNSAAARWARRQRQQQLPGSPAAAGGATAQHAGATHHQQTLGGPALLSANASPQRAQRTQQQPVQQQQVQQSASYSVSGNAFHPPSSPLPLQQPVSCTSPGGGRQAVEQAASAAAGMLPQGGFFSFLKGGSRSQAAAPTSSGSSSSSRSESLQQQPSSKRQPPLLPSASEADTPAYVVPEERSSSGDFSPSSSRSSSRGRSSPPPAVRPHRQQPSRSLSGTVACPAPETRSEGFASRGGPFYFSAALRGGAIHLPQVPSVIAPSEIPSEREQIETDLIKSLIWSYFQIVRKNVADAVPKSVMYFMVNTAKDVLQRELVSQLYREELFNELLKEGEDICERRARCKQLLRSLRGAADILAQIRDHGSSVEECGGDGGFPLTR